MPEGVPVQDIPHLTPDGILPHSGKDIPDMGVRKKIFGEKFRRAELFSVFIL